MSTNTKNILIDLDNTMVVCNIYYQFAKTNLVKYVHKLSNKSESEITELLEKFELERLNSIDAFSSKTFPEVFVKTLYAACEGAGMDPNSYSYMVQLSPGEDYIWLDGDVTMTHHAKVVKLAESVFNSAPYTIYPTVNDTLMELDDRGYNCYIVTKGDFYTQLRKIQDLAKVFKGVFIIPVKNSEVYSGIVRTIGSTPSECLMIGDSPSDDIIAAHTAGLKTIWVKRKAKTSWVGDPFVKSFEYDHSVEYFSDLLKIL